MESDACGLPDVNVSHLLRPSKVLLRPRCLLMPLLLPLGVLRKDQSDTGSVLASLCAVDVLGDGDMSRFFLSSSLDSLMTAGICVLPLGCPVVPNHFDSSMSFSIFQSISDTCFMKGSRSTDCKESLSIQMGSVLGTRSDRIDGKHTSEIPGPTRGFMCRKLSPSTRSP